MMTLDPDTEPRQRCFAPVVDDRTRLLILGSLPGEKSLVLQEYYGNRQNKFWELVGAVIALDLRAMAYPARLAALQAHGIGLWDVVAQAQRTGSLDSNIRQRRDNDLCALLQRYPGIRAIAFNGGTAARFGIRLLGVSAPGYRIVTLPSSSPAHTLSYAEKATSWRVLQDILAGG